MATVDDWDMWFMKECGTNKKDLRFRQAFLYLDAVLFLFCFCNVNKLWLFVSDKQASVKLSFDFLSEC